MCWITEGVSREQWTNQNAVFMSRVFSHVTYDELASVCSLVKFTLAGCALQVHGGVRCGTTILNMYTIIHVLYSIGKTDYCRFN